MKELTELKDFAAAIIFGSLVLLPLAWCLYSRGMQDGVEHYKRSRQFQLTLQSMYRFGVADGCTDDHLCDLAGYPAEEGGNR